MIQGLGGSLVQRAATRLLAGPVHTLQLARDILGLTGHPGASAQAIFTLLGRDERFHVDPQGMWRLLDVRNLPGPPLAEVGFAVVDVETTGGSFDQGHKIIEIAVVEVRGGAVVDEWRTLVNPGRPIGFFVQDLTGIRTDMVLDAPHFEHVAAEIQRRLEGRVFVAHNVGFDWRFVSTELTEALGNAPDVRRLCTVKLVRCLLPRLKRRNLDAVTAHFGLRVHERHRAYGDALATARVLLRLLDEAAGQGIVDFEGLVDRMQHRRRRRHKRRGGVASRVHRERRERSDAAQVELLDLLPPPAPEAI
jgi:DNA polymerase III epsilon subunit family exonuclease